MSRPPTLRNRIKWARRRILARPVGKRTTVVRRARRPPQPIGSFRLYGICCAFTEEDIIEASVLNAFAQGCERVFLIDHASPDRTVQRAIDVGAEHVADMHAHTPFEEGRLNTVNDLVRDISEDEPGDPIWWLHFDADEFPRGPLHMTVRDYLCTLDARYRVVGSTFVNHYPTDAPANVRAKHPIELQPFCERELFSYCSARHFKHPLQRYDFDAPGIRQCNGLHRPEPSPHAPWAEPRRGIVTHHFQFRNEAETRRRMGLVLERKSKGGQQPIEQRADCLDAVYSGAWSDVRLRRTRLGNRPVRLRHWQDLEPGLDPSWDVRHDEADRETA